MGMPYLWSCWGKLKILKRDVSRTTYVDLFVIGEILIIEVASHDSYVLLIFIMIKFGPFPNIRCFGI